MKSCSTPTPSKGYKLSEKGKLLATQGEPQSEIEQDSGPIAPTEDLFSDIIGHEDVKKLLRAAVLAEKPVRVLLAGPPTLAKSLFPWGLERAAQGRALWLVGVGRLQDGPVGTRWPGGSPESWWWMRWTRWLPTWGRCSR
ncbi:MAG: hypothetical protein Q8O40_08030 [Chloroflexota bacterium]|nr:hypothetical protein [Chloroflexota bacterium]